MLVGTVSLLIHVLQFEGAQCMVINPRRACARVTVLGLSVCVCVFSLFWHLAQSGVQTAVISDFSAIRA